jgi:hypothetical protein
MERGGGDLKKDAELTVPVSLVSALLRKEI